MLQIFKWPLSRGGLQLSDFYTYLIWDRTNGSVVQAQFELSPIFQKKCYKIKLHALIRLGVNPTSFAIGVHNGVLCGFRQSH
jgi:hypothetical protein